jgi:negative regulator of replication initiation
MRKLQRDHNRRVRDLVDERDALGLVREQQAYEDQRREAEESHRIEMRRRNEDYAMQLRDMETNFALQRQRRLEDFQRQQQELGAQQQARLAQLDAQHALEMQKLAEQEKARLEQFDKNYKAELEQLQNAEQQRLNILRSLALNDHSALQKAGMELTARYRAWLQQAAQSFLTPAPASVPIRGRASGGWVNAGAPYWVGERGPELLIPHTSGNIIPTHRILSNERGETTRADSSGVNMRIETSSLTLAQVIREIDKRLARNNRALAEAFA